GSLGIRGFHSIVSDYIMPIPSSFGNAVPTGTAAPTNLHRNYNAFGFNFSDPAFNYNASTASLDYAYTNVSRVTLTGAEVALTVPITRWLTADGTAAYVDGINHSPMRHIDGTGTYIPTKGAEALAGIYPLNASLRLRAIEPTYQHYGVELIARFVNGQHYVAQ